MANAQLEDKIFVIPDHIMKFVKPGTMRSDFILRRKDEITYYNIKRLKHFFDVEKEKDPETYNALGGDEMETWVNKVLDTHRSMSLKGKRIRSDVGMQNVFKKSHFKQSENGIYSKPKIFRPETKARQLWTGKGLYEGMFKPRNLDSRLDVWNKQQPEKDGVKINQYNETGQPDGYWDDYLIDGEVVHGKGSFIDGKKEGYWEEYMLDELLGSGFYVNNKEEGIWEFYEDGEISKKWVYKKGKIVDRWYPPKDLKEGLFKPRNLGPRYVKWNSEQPEIDGIKINQYDSEGKEIGVWGSVNGFELFNPDKDSVIYNQWNSLQPEIDGDKINQYDNEGKKQGVWLTLFDNGVPETKRTFVHGVLDGECVSWGSNGMLKVVGSYKNNKRHGVWTHYSSFLFDDRSEVKWDNGKMIFESKVFNLTENKRLFKPRNMDRWEKWNSEQPEIDGIKINQYDNDGKKQGKWKDIDGKFHSIYNYVNDERDGEFITYNNKGFLITKGQYVDGIRDGLWIFYKKDGDDKDFTCLYENGKIKKINGRINGRIRK